MAGTLASYLLGDSVTQFSTVIGVYLSALGLGSWLSRYVQRGLAAPLRRDRAGGGAGRRLRRPRCCSSPSPSRRYFRAVLYGLVVAVGTLVGLEIPLLLRILREPVDFKELVAKVLTFDYAGRAGRLAAVPAPAGAAPGPGAHLALFGLANAAVGLWSTWLFAPRPGGARASCACSAVAAVLVPGRRASSPPTGSPTWAEDGLYADDVVLAQHVALPAHRAHALAATTSTCS